MMYACRFFCTYKVLYPDVASRLYERLDHLEVSRRGRQVQRRLAVRVHHDGRAGAEQVQHAPGVAGGDGGAELALLGHVEGVGEVLEILERKEKINWL